MSKISVKKYFKYAIPIIRIIIGMAFLLSGLFKIIDIGGFRKVIQSLGMLGGPLPLMVSIIIPVLELILGLMLVLGIQIRIAAVHLNVLAAIFAWVTYYILGSRPDMLCGCFGTLFDMSFSIYHLLVLFLIFLLNMVIVVEPADTWTLQKIFRDRITAARKVLLVEILTYVFIAAGIAIIGFAIYLNIWGKKEEPADITVNREILVVEDEEYEQEEAEGVVGNDQILAVEDDTSVQDGEAEVIPISVDEAYDAYDDPDFVFIDVRSQFEYDHSHIMGAMLIPVTEIEDRLDEIPDDKSIIVYCNGSSCDRSGRAAGILVDNGFNDVYDLTGDGIDEWESKGYPVE